MTTSLITSGERLKQLKGSRICRGYGSASHRLETDWFDSAVLTDNERIPVLIGT